VTETDEIRTLFTPVCSPRLRLAKHSVVSLMPAAIPIVIAADELFAFVSRLFVAAGLSETAAKTIAEGLVEADLDGVPSHGVMLVDLYLDRLRHGSVSSRATVEIVSDHGCAVVVNAQHAFGHITGTQSIDIAIARAKQYGAGIVAVRHGFHFGTARRYAVKAIGEGCIGIVMCNTRPLMPAPGGAERVVGNNPISIAIPSDSSVPLVLDMATSEAAMGKIRMADKAGQAIPANWAVRNDGSPTTVAKEAIAGMLLPAAGPKGFGLSLMIDLMCGLLSSGAVGQSVMPLYGDPRIPYDCSHLFIAVDVAHFCDVASFRIQAGAAAERIRQGPRAPETTQLFLPGEPEWRRHQNANGHVQLERAVAETLIKVAQELQVSAEPLLTISRKTENAHHAET
jgi:LDH2 family malate/lactate/ureidoglycolate dehydrogenase